MLGSLGAPRTPTGPCCVTPCGGKQFPGCSGPQWGSCSLLPCRFCQAGWCLQVRGSFLATGQRAPPWVRPCSLQEPPKLPCFFAGDSSPWTVVTESSSYQTTYKLSFKDNQDLKSVSKRFHLRICQVHELLQKYCSKRDFMKTDSRTQGEAYSIAIIPESLWKNEYSLE